MKRVLVTGAGGFVGSVLCNMLAQSGWHVRAAVRHARPTPTGASEHAVVGDIGGDISWREALLGVDSVVHLAARAHILGDSPANADQYTRANALGTSNLARESAAAGVRQFVFLSSIKVNGDATASRAFNSNDEPRPRDAYARSKWEGEKFAMIAGRESGMRIAIVRPPLVYGPGVKANFLRLMQWIDEEKILPLGAVHNKRSLVSVWNLCDLIIRLLTGCGGPSDVWMASDGEDLSTPDLVRRLAKAMGRRERLLPLPVGVLRLVGHAVGYQAQIDRLCGSLMVDIAKTRSDLAWFPPVSVDDGLERTAHWYLSEGRGK